MKITLEIPGPPVPKARGRMVPLQQCKRCGKKTARRQCSCGSSELQLVTVMNSPTSETTRYENLVRLVAADAMREQGIERPLTDLLRVTIDAHFLIPASRGCGKEHHPGGAPRNTDGCKKVHLMDHHGQRPDLDNLQKSVLDGLNKVLFADDGQVCQIVAAKWWGNQPRVVVTVETL